MKMKSELSSGRGWFRPGPPADARLPNGPPPVTRLSGSRSLHQDRLLGHNVALVPWLSLIGSAYTGKLSLEFAR